jgi:hypothetical protein
VLNIQEMGQGAMVHWQRAGMDAQEYSALAASSGGYPHGGEPGCITMKVGMIGQKKRHLYIVMMQLALKS